MRLVIAEEAHLPLVPGEGVELLFSLHPDRCPSRVRSTLRRSGGGRPRARRRAFERPASEVNRRVELSATVSEAVADAFENAKALQMEGSGVVVRDIAGPDSSLATTHESLSGCALRREPSACLSLARPPRARRCRPESSTGYGIGELSARSKLALRASGKPVR
jgi:hypothetical protein